MDRAYAEGTDLVVEGNHLLPGFLQHLRPTRYVLLWAPPDQLAYRLFGATHRNRAISEEEVTRVILTQEYLVSQAQAYNIPVIVNANVGATVDAILETHEPPTES